MNAERLFWSGSTRVWVGPALNRPADLVLFFGRRERLACASRYHELRSMFPSARILGCSSAGQIHNDDVVDDGITAIAITFNATRIALASEHCVTQAESLACGTALGQQLAAPDLAGILMLSDGLNVNGSQLLHGLRQHIGAHVPITGGLAGDGSNFKETLVSADGPPVQKLVGAVGFYGTAIRFGHGCAGGWDEFGPSRVITRSQASTVYEFDGEPALDLYQRYLGEEAADLPASGLRFPLLIRDPSQPEHSVVRSLKSVDPVARSIEFAADVPCGWQAQLLRGVFDRLADGAGVAAQQASRHLPPSAAADQLAIIVSCVGRRLLMGQSVMDELDAISAVLGANVHRLGFYSYGEFAPHAVSGLSEIHNETLTITTLTEAA